MLLKLTMFGDNSFANAYQPCRSVADCEYLIYFSQTETDSMPIHARLAIPIFESLSRPAHPARKSFSD
jgi:hypothetical protein